MNSKCCTNCIDKFNKVRKKNKKKVVLSICKNNIIKFIRNNVKNRIDPWKLELVQEKYKHFVPPVS